MTPNDFIARWKNNTATERAGAQAHFIDLCKMLGEDAPNANPQDIQDYAFEKGAKRTGAGHGWADVWKRGNFAWEYKKPGSNLSTALKQLMTYALALDNPPLLVVSDRLQIHIHTHFTGTPSETHTINLDDIGSSINLQKLRWLFNAPEKFKPQRTTAGLTQEAAKIFGDLAYALQSRGHAPQKVAHFLNKVLFCMFAEDAAAPGQDPLLPDKIFTQILANGMKDLARFERQLGNLFQAMSKRDGEFGALLIDWFNGGLFDDDVIVPLLREDVQKLVGVAKLDWSQIEPSIFGTLFERGLNPKKRSQLGAHYTDQQSIMRIIRPVVIDPLVAEWEAIREKIKLLMDIVHALEKSDKAVDKKKGTLALKDANGKYIAFIERLKAFRILDPACGSGNFLYMALQSLKDIELRVMLEAEELGLQRGFPQVGPDSVLGLELDAYAAELARVTIWIGEIQWMLKHGFQPSRNPILKTLNQIQCRDALITEKGDLVAETPWPAVDVIVGNPPFLGGSKKRSELGDKAFENLSKIFDGRVPPGADLVCYWFDKARVAIESGRAHMAGLVATNSIRGGSNRIAIKKIGDNLNIFNAWSDQEWVNEGAAVRVSIICFGDTSNGQRRLDDKDVSAINADLTAPKGDAKNTNLTLAKPLLQNKGKSFRGSAKVGEFEIPGELARQWLKMPNPNLKNNSDVLSPWANGLDLMRRPSDYWIIDFGTSREEDECEQYELPFKHVVEKVKPLRLNGRRAGRKTYWWRLGETIPGVRSALKPLRRYIATAMVAKHRVFVWLDHRIFPDQQIILIALDDDTTFGILSSRFHRIWSIRLGTSLEDRPRYTSTTCFDTYPFPEGMTPDIPTKDRMSSPLSLPISVAAKCLCELRGNWLNPPEWTEKISEQIEGYPERIVPKKNHDEDIKSRTLTNLYNQYEAGNAAWLAKLHENLDRAVAAAYGWADYSADMADEEILARLLTLNLQRSTK